MAQFFNTNFFNTNRALNTIIAFAAVNAFAFATAFFGMWKHEEYPEVLDTGAQYIFPTSGFCLTAIGVISAMNWFSKEAGAKQDTSLANRFSQHIIPPVAATLADAGVVLTLVNKGPELLKETLPPYLFATAVGGIILADCIKIANYAKQNAAFTALAVFGLMGHLAAEAGLVQNMIVTSLPSWLPLAGMIGMGAYGTALTAYLISQTDCFQAAIAKCRGGYARLDNSENPLRNDELPTHRYGSINNA